MQPSGGFVRLFMWMGGRTAETERTGEEGERATLPFIVRRVNGNVDAPFDAFYRDRYVAMVRLAALLVDRVELAEEIVQDSFAVTYRRFGELDAPVAFLRTVVVNRCRDTLRRRRFERGTAAPDEPVHDAPDEMADAIARLPHRQRTAVVLRFYEDLTIDQVADAMGSRPGTVKSLLSRAMARLREEIPR